jgi:hypothetical protein
VQVNAVEPGFPFYGVIETAPAGEWSRLGETGGVLVDQALLPALGHVPRLGGGVGRCILLAPAQSERRQAGVALALLLLAEP